MHVRIPRSPAHRPSGPATRRATALGVGTVGVGLVLGTASAALPQDRPAATPATDTVQHVHHRQVSAVRGARFRCGDLTLRVTRGKELETFDGLKARTVTYVRIERSWSGVRLHGSDGHTYRAGGRTEAAFVLLAPDTENPVWGREDIIVRFTRAHQARALWLRERLRIKDGSETDEVTGPCDFG